MRTTDWIQTYTGRRFYPFESNYEDVYIEDIAHALSLVCRFGGHCKHHYSVAQHSVLVSEHCKYRMHGLLHDAEEAYIADVCRPVKRSLRALGITALDDAASKIMMAVSRRFELEWSVEIKEDVKTADNVLLATEARDLMLPMLDGGMWTSADVFPTLDQKIVPVDPTTAERMFLHRYRELTSASI